MSDVLNWLALALGPSFSAAALAATSLSMAFDSREWEAGKVQIAIETRDCKLGNRRGTRTKTDAGSSTQISW